MKESVIVALAILMLVGFCWSHNSHRLKHANCPSGWKSKNYEAKTAEYKHAYSLLQVGVRKMGPKSFSFSSKVTASCEQNRGVLKKYMIQFRIIPNIVCHRPGQYRMNSYACYLQCKVYGGEKEDVHCKTVPSY